MAKVTIVGAGNMGRGIGTRAVAGGHQVEIVDHDRAEAEKLAGELGENATVLEPGAPPGGDIVVTNPVDTQTWDKLATPPGVSSAEEVQQLVPQGTPVVKAFTTFAPTLVAGEVAGQQLDVLIAGDDDAAKQKVSQLASDAGLRPIDVGPSAAPSRSSSSASSTSRCSSRTASASAAPSSSSRPRHRRRSRPATKGRSAWRSASPPCSTSTGR